jgi:hypothetical protein
MMFIKLSIGVFLLRLCVKRVYVWIIWISLAIISIWSIVLFFWNLFQCKPVEMQWDFRIKDGTCVSADQIVSAAYAISVMTVVSDWLYVSETLVSSAKLLHNTERSIGPSTNPNAVVGQDDQASKGNCYCNFGARYIVSWLSSLFRTSSHIPSSASVATLVRLRFLADLTDTEDILCE